jgi:hypothetical protein
MTLVTLLMGVLLFYAAMPVLLVLQTTQKAPYYPPFKSAIDRLGAKRILKSAWLFDHATQEQVAQAVRIYLPNSDGYVVAEVSIMEQRPVFKP